jgi:hypothetical protein
MVGCTPLVYGSEPGNPMSLSYLDSEISRGVYNLSIVSLEVVIKLDCLSGREFKICETVAFSHSAFFFLISSKSSSLGMEGHDPDPLQLGKMLAKIP